MDGGRGMAGVVVEIGRGFGARRRVFVEDRAAGTGVLRVLDAEGGRVAHHFVEERSPIAEQDLSAGKLGGELAGDALELGIEAGADLTERGNRCGHEGEPEATR